MSYCKDTRLKHLWNSVPCFPRRPPRPFFDILLLSTWLSASVTGVGGCRAYVLRPQGMLAPWIELNPVQPQPRWRCGRSFFVGRCSLSSDFYVFQSKPVPESVYRSLPRSKRPGVSPRRGPLAEVFGEAQCFLAQHIVINRNTSSVRLPPANLMFLPS